MHEETPHYTPSLANNAFASINLFALACTKEKAHEKEMDRDLQMFELSGREVILFLVELLNFRDAKLLKHCADAKVRKSESLISTNRVFSCNSALKKYIKICKIIKTKETGLLFQ